jgi:CRISPR/Cas system CSM-associated protein Csm3 (group 7 of RAMP superfamily)
MNELFYRPDHRHIIKRIIIRGVLILDTPTCLGKGDADSPVDLPLLRDSISNNALLTGSSIAGALRNYLRERKKGYGKRDCRHEAATMLFGDLFAYDEEKDLPEDKKIEAISKDSQSQLIINDALSTDVIKAELRDGVKINSVTHTAEEKKKYDLELLEAGTKFPICLELLINKNADENILKQALTLAIEGLEPNDDSVSGEICIGMRKRRGFGRCHVKEWQVWEFNLENFDDRMAWLTLDHSWKNEPFCAKEAIASPSIATALGVNLEEEDKRDRITMQATFTLTSPLLIRSGEASSNKAPDVVHLKSRRNGKLKSILSGTSLAGVLRHRGERIVNTLKKDKNIINKIFGFTDENTKEAKASRLIVDEVEINDTTDLVQNRIAIDRFTGGALHGALFNEQPIFANDKTNLEITLQLRQPKDSEIGLLLLLLKDLWTGDLTVGGTSSIGRGRLQGRSATIKYGDRTWTISQNSNEEFLTIDNPEDLEKFVAALYNEVTP